MIHSPLLEDIRNTRTRCRELYGLLLAYQSQPKDIIGAPWTARLLELANKELKSLQAWHRDGMEKDLRNANALRKLRTRHEKAMKAA